MIRLDRQLENVYRHESDADVRERILLVRRVMVDREEAASVAELELHRSRGWAYKWMHILQTIDRHMVFDIYNPNTLRDIL